MPLLDLDVARGITEGIVLVLARLGLDASAPAASTVAPATDRAEAHEYAERLRRRDLREVLLLRDLEVEPRWPDLWNPRDSNHERVFIRVGADRDRVYYASAIFNGSLVHWEAATADTTGSVTWSQMDPDRHWTLNLQASEKPLREMGLTVIPPAALPLKFGRWTLAALLNPREHNLRAAADEVQRVAESIRNIKGIRSPAQAYERVLNLLRLGYDLSALAVELEGRTPESLAELTTWLTERNPPFAWTRPDA